MLCTIIIARLVGSTPPILAKREHLDLVIMTNPFITTIVDMLSLIIYFQFATMKMKTYT